MEVICFHNPDEENGFLSNWYLSQFEVGHTKFSSMEQFMMYKKAVCFGDHTIAEQILRTEDAAQVKNMGRLVSNYDDQLWSGVRQLIVYEGLQAKFLQNDLLNKKLKETGNSLLVECAVKDCIWGIGLSMSDPRRLNPKQWRGQNLLGYTLMMVRDCEG